MATETKNKPQNKKQASSPGNFFAIEIVLFVIIMLLVVYRYSAVVIDTASSFSGNIFVARLILTLKIISGIVATSSIVGILYVSASTQHFVPRLSQKKPLPTDAEDSENSKETSKNVQNDWAKLREKLEASSDRDAQALIIEADNITDKALRFLKLPGETMGERLEALSGRGLRSLDDLWQAHKLRNELVHEVGVEARYSDALWAIEKYEKALKELDMLY